MAKTCGCGLRGAARAKTRDTGGWVKVRGGHLYREGNLYAAVLPQMFGWAWMARVSGRLIDRGEAATVAEAKRLANLAMLTGKPMPARELFVTAARMEREMGLRGMRRSRCGCRR